MGYHPQVGYRLHTCLVPYCRNGCVVAPKVQHAELAVCRAVGERVRLRRIANDLTQQELAALAGEVHDPAGAASRPLDRAFVVNIERGQVNPSLLTLHRLALALDVSLADLMPGAEEIKAQNKR